MSNFKRYAIVGGTREQIEAYLPSNYTIAGVVPGTYPKGELEPVDFGSTVVIEGRDNAGWTMDSYVIPRLASGMHFANEVGLDHPVFKLIPEVQS